MRFLLFLRLSYQQDATAILRLRFGLDVATEFKGFSCEQTRSPPVPACRSTGVVGGDQSVVSMPYRSAAKRIQSSVTSNTVVVLSAIAALIVILVLLESRIHRLSVHAAPRRIFDNFVKQETQRYKHRFVTTRLATRKTLNQRSLLFRAPTRNRMETALHASGVQAILVFHRDCGSPTVRSPEALSGDAG